MKKKFSSMGRVIIALVLLAGLSLVPTVAMGQGSSNYAEYELDEVGSGTADWSDVEARSGKYSAKLFLPSGAVDPDAAAVILAYDDSLASLPTVDVGETHEVVDVSKFSFYCLSQRSGEEKFPTLPYIVLDIDTDEDPERDYVLVSRGSRRTDEADPELDVWQMLSPNDHESGTPIGGWVCYAVSETAEPASSSYENLGYWQNEDVTAGGTVLNVKLWFGELPGARTQDETAYVDDITIDATTYDLQPEIFTDAYFYQTGDTVMVTLIYGDENTNPAVSESVGVNAYIDTPYQEIVVALQETGVDTGVFEGTFDLVATSPGPGELYVSHDIEIKVYYSDLDWFEDYCYVDDFAPVVDITAPVANDNVSGTVSIEGTVVEENLDTWSLEIDGTEVEATYAVVDEVTGTVSYSWDTTEVVEEVPRWPDGTYTLNLLAQDLAGSFAFESVSATVDNTVPVITLQMATPAVIPPDEETPVVFTATVTDVNVDTVTINLSDVGGASAEPMLDDGEGDDATADDGIYTASENITESIEGTYALTVTATDEATNSATEDVSFGVALDTIPPVITSPAITYLYGSSAQPGETVTISANVTDEPDGLIEVVQATCAELTDSPIALLDGDDIYTGTGTVDSEATAGDYTITITAIDTSGNPATPVTLTLTVDPAATGYEIALADGWNMISLPLIPADGSIDVVLADISENVSQLRTWVYEAGVLVEKVWINDGPAGFTQMTAGQGYWILMTEGNVLIATGVELPAPPQAPPSYSLNEGWNLIGFKSLKSDTPVGEYLGGAVMDTFERMYGYDAAGGLYTVIEPLTGTLKPGQGYWLAVSADGTIYP